MTRDIKKIHIIGLGALGSMYGGKLFELNPNCVKIIASKEREEQYKKFGTTVNGETYDFNYVQPAKSTSNEEPTDLIIISVKQHHLVQAIKDIKGFVGKDTIILSLLNGITSEGIIGKEFGMEKLLYSFCVGTDAVRIDRNTIYTKMGKIVFGERVNTEHSHKVKLIKDLFERANIPFEVPKNMIRELWWKFMLNVGINQVSAVLKASYRIFQENEEARNLMEMACKEVVNLSRHEGINLEDKDIKKAFEIINSLSGEGKTSMLQDTEAGRKTEVEIFAGTVIELGKKHGIETPVNDILFKMIRSLEYISSI